mgnify:FL=1
MWKSIKKQYKHILALYNSLNYIMHEFNHEQQHIYDLILKKFNVIVEAVAGTGKTTTVLGIASKQPNMKILQVTYNKALRKDVQDNAAENNIQNIQVHTYHSLAKKYYLRSGYTDKEIRKTLHYNEMSMKPIQDFDLLVIDEVQDMTPLYYQLMVKFITDYGRPIQMLILGDKKQSLYDFKGSDERFLTAADSIWQPLPFLTAPFHRAEMHISYRITKPMAQFVNNTLLGEERMKAVREGTSVDYVCHSPYNINNTIQYEIKTALENGYSPGDIFILAASIKGKNKAVSEIENLLVNDMNVPCYIPNQESDQIDERVANRKVVFSTFHSVKGRGRKLVFLLGCDNSYFIFYNRVSNKTVCPNTIYVGATRGSERLYLFEEYDNSYFAYKRPLPFLKQNHYQMKTKDYIKFRGHARNIPPLTEEEENEIKNNGRPKRESVTDLTRFIPEDVLDFLTPLLESVYEKQELNMEPLEIPTIMEAGSGYFEEVSDINGNAIPAYCIDSYLKDREEYVSQSSQLLVYIDFLLNDGNKRKKTIYLEKRQEIPNELDTIQDYLLTCNLLKSMEDRLVSRLRQIDCYNWLDSSIIEECKTNFYDILKDEMENCPQTEVDIIEEDDDVVHNEINNELRNELLLPKKILLRGRADLITDNSVYELKCTSETSIEHFIQLAVYAWMWHMKYKNHPKESKKQFKLYNMKLNELYTLRATPQQLYSVVVALLKAKEQKIKKVDDDVFIEISHREIEKYQMMTEDVNVHCVPTLQNDLDYQDENEHA